MITSIKNGMALITFSILASACGPDISGSYYGQQTIRLQNGQSITDNVTINISQEGDKLSGTWFGSDGGGNFTSTFDGQNLNSVNLLLSSNLVNQNPYYVPGQPTSPTTQPGAQIQTQGQYQTATSCTSTLVGNLNYLDGRISGTVSSNGDNPFCGTSMRTIIVSRQSKEKKKGLFE